jgi:hypothetical protein
MNIISRIFCYPLLERQSARDRVRARVEINRLRAELRDWQNKALNRHGFSPLGDEAQERTEGGQVAKSQVFNLKPLVAQYHEQWDEQEAEEMRQGFPLPVPSLTREEEEDLLREAENLT